MAPTKRSDRNKSHPNNEQSSSLQSFVEARTGAIKTKGEYKALGKAFKQEYYSFLEKKRQQDPNLYKQHTNKALNEFIEQEFKKFYNPDDRSLDDLNLSVRQNRMFNLLLAVHAFADSAEGEKIGLNGKETVKSFRAYITETAISMENTGAFDDARLHYYADVERDLKIIMGVVERYDELGSEKREIKCKMEEELETHVDVIKHGAPKVTRQKVSGYSPLATVLGLYDATKGFFRGRGQSNKEKQDSSRIEQARQDPVIAAVSKTINAANLVAGALQTGETVTSKLSRSSPSELSEKEKVKDKSFAVWKKIFDDLTERNKQAESKLEEAIKACSQPDYKDLSLVTANTVRIYAHNTAKITLEGLKNQAVKERDNVATIVKKAEALSEIINERLKQLEEFETSKDESIKAEASKGEFNNLKEQMVECMKLSLVTMRQRIAYLEDNNKLSKGDQQELKEAKALLANIKQKYKQVSLPDVDGLLASFENANEVKLLGSPSLTSIKSTAMMNFGVSDRYYKTLSALEPSDLTPQQQGRLQTAIKADAFRRLEYAITCKYRFAKAPASEQKKEMETLLSDMHTISYRQLEKQGATPQEIAVKEYSFLVELDLPKKPEALIAAIRERQAKLAGALYKVQESDSDLLRSRMIRDVEARHESLAEAIAAEKSMGRTLIRFFTRNGLLEKLEAQQRNIPNVEGISADLPGDSRSAKDVVKEVPTLPGVIYEGPAKENGPPAASRNSKIENEEHRR